MHKVFDDGLRMINVESPHNFIIISVPKQTESTCPADIYPPLTSCVYESPVSVHGNGILHTQWPHWEPPMVRSSSHHSCSFDCRSSSCLLVSRVEVRRSDRWRPWLRDWLNLAQTGVACLHMPKKGFISDKTLTELLICMTDATFGSGAHLEHHNIPDLWPQYLSVAWYVAMRLSGYFGMMLIS